MYKVEANDGGKHGLHGGSLHWGRQEWRVADERHENDGESVTFELESPDGDAGYPGAMQVQVKYELRAWGADTELAMLRITMTAAALDKATPVNLVQHTHWNLAGAAAVSQVGHS